MVNLRLVHSSNGECEKQPVDDNPNDEQLDSSAISDIYPENQDQIALFENVRKARMALVRAFSQSARKSGKGIEESNLKYVDPKRFGERFEITLQDFFFTFREELSGVIYWIRFNRGQRDKGPSINWHIDDLNWGQVQSDT